MRSSKALVLGVIVAWSAGCGSAKVEVEPATFAQPQPQPAQLQPAPAPAPAQVAVGDAVLEGDRIRIAKNIFYDTDKDVVSPESHGVLNNVAEIVKTHPEITQLTVEGHTDNQGSTEYNIKLSERRANAVVRYLVSVGVKTPMVAPGYGAASPVCMTPDEACKAQNRRVEFRVKRSGF
ncbi:OmpA family protein [Chondromyces apiculatus]|nr:OmpA family protein [Chondromyces apiculatus]